MKDQEEKRRDLFVAAALTGIIPVAMDSNSRYDDWSDREIADWAVHLASATMALLDREAAKDEAN